MGMDYEYSGSASYPRFEREVCEISKLFGGVESEELEKLKDINQKQWDNCGSFTDLINHGFGFFHNVDGDSKIVFPHDTDPVIIKFANNPYKDLTVEETAKLYELFTEYKEEIENISYQMYHELESRFIRKEGWHIN